MDRRIFLQSLLAGVASPVLAEAPVVSARPIVRPVDLAARAAPGAADIIRAANLSGHTSALFIDLQSGEAIGAAEPLRALPPASVAKVITALYALDRLGASHRFKTQIGYTGQLVNGRLEGDIVLLGSGDPTLDTDGLAQLAAEVKRAGVREVRGKVLVWAGALPNIREIDGSQPDHVGYNPAVSGLNLNFNRVHFEWKSAQTGYAITMQARTERYRPSVAMARMAIAERSMPVYTYRGSDDLDQWTVARRALGQNGSRWLPVRAPAAYAGDVIVTLLRSHGIVVREYQIVDRRPDTRVLAQIRSEDLRRICRDMLKFSTNLTAESLGLAASGAQTLRQSAKDMSSWASSTFGTRNVKLVDHSGLGDASRVSARDVVSVLSATRARNELRPLLKPFKLRDVEAKNNTAPGFAVNAKTGTLNFVSGLAGYVDVPGRAGVAFAVFSADMPTRSSLAKSEREAPAGGRRWSGRARVLQSELIRGVGLPKSG